MAYQPIEPVGLGRNVANEMMKGGPRLQQEMKTMGPDTIKMIALQQIADQEKQRAMQANMQAQPNPATVMQQVEQEVMQMAQSKQPAGMPMMRDRIPQVGGVLAQKQRMQQQNMQRAGRPQPRPQQPPVRAAMGGLMTQAAPNIHPRYFESGGIVAFANGSSGPIGGGTAGSGLMGTPNLYNRTSLLGGMRRSAFEDIVEKIRKGESLSSGERKAIRDYSEEFPELADKLAEMRAAAAMGGAGVLKRPDQAIVDFTEEVTEDVVVDEPLAPYTGVKLPEPEKEISPFIARQDQGIASTPQAKTLDSALKKGPAFEKSAPIAMPEFDPMDGPGSATAKLKEGLGQLIDRDPAKTGEEGIAAYKKAMALPEDMQAERKQIMERRRKEAFEPEKPSKLSTIASMFASAANRGSLGSIGAGMVKTANNIERAAKENNKAAFDKYSAEFEKEMQRTQEIGKGALEYGRSLSAEDRADIRAGLSAMQGLASTEMKIDSDRQLQALDTALKNADIDSRERIALASNETAQEANRLREEGNRITREGRSLDALDRLEANITIQMATAAAKIAENYTLRIQGLQSAADSADAEDAEEAQTQLTKLREQIQLEQDAVMAPLQELLEEYSSRRASMTGAGAGADELKTLLQKYK
jgi:hypothetical protein